MLTSTYTLVALSVEQATVRGALQSLADALHTLPDMPAVAPARAAGLCARLREVFDNYHWRKLDKFLIPALRRSDAAFHALLDDLETLSRSAAGAMAAAEACVDGADRVDTATFRDAALHCIQALRLRLEREEGELFPLARSVLGMDAWFTIANQMMAHDAYAMERRAEQAPAPLRRRVPALDPHPLPAEGGRRHGGLSIAH